MALHKRVDNMLLPLLNVIAPEANNTRKLCFYYTCKFGVISITYVIITTYSIHYVSIEPLTIGWMISSSVDSSAVDVSNQ